MFGRLLALTSCLAIASPAFAALTGTVINSPDVLNTARYFAPVPGSSAAHATLLSWLRIGLLLILLFKTSNTFLLVSNESVKLSLSGRLPPNINGDLKMHHNVITVRCSSFVKFAMRGLPLSARIPMRPSGNMSPSGYAP